MTTRSFTLTLTYLSLIVLIPIAALVAKSATLGGHLFWQTITASATVSAYRVSFAASAIGDRDLRVDGRIPASPRIGVLREHPWPVVRSFLIGKPVDQLAYFSVTPELWRQRNYLNPMIMAVAATLLALALGAALPTRRTALLGLAVAAAVVACSTMTSFFYPTALIAEVLVTWLMLFMVGAIYLPLALLFYVLRQRAVPAAAAS